MNQQSPKQIKHLILIMLLTACATAPKVDDQSEFKLSEKKDSEPLTVVASKSIAGTATYKFNQKQWNAQWMRCSVQKSKGLVLALHEHARGFDVGSACSEWPAQVFLQQGYDVIAVNRPGYGASTGTNDLSGPHSIAAIKASLESAKAPQLSGIWGYDSGAIAAAFFAKQNPTLASWLMLGGGIYDLEIVARTTTDESLKTLVTTLKAAEGEIFFERRSIAWDFSGLPKKLVLYHAKDDTMAPYSQKASFNDQLRTAEYKVFQNDIVAGGHNLPQQDHAQIIIQGLKQLTSP